MRGKTCKHAFDVAVEDRRTQAANDQRYASESKTGVGYSLAAAGEYKFGKWAVCPGCRWCWH